MSKVAKAVRTGMRSITGRDKKKEAEKEAKRLAAEAEANEKREIEKTNQSTNKTRQESADLGSLTEQSDRESDEMAGILTSVEGLVPGDRKLNKKKSLGG